MRRNKGTTEQRKKEALDRYVEYGTIVSACRAARISRTQLYFWRNNDPKFAKELADARAVVADDLEQEAIRRAKAGSDLLLIFLLKAYKPKKYRKRINTSHHVGQRLHGFLATIGPPCERV